MSVYMLRSFHIFTFPSPRTADSLKGISALKLLIDAVEDGALVEAPARR